jgi:tripartite-type tricarboxylate transporter receptor subunit TctC
MAAGPRTLVRIAGLASLASLAMTPAAANPAEFYKGQNITLGVPNAAGGGYDVYARVLARHYGKYVPGRPNIIVQNVPAAGGMALANNLFVSAPRDGTYLGMIRGTVVQEQVFKSPQVQFDARAFEWIGNMNADYDGCAVGARSPVKTIDDFYKHETAVGASGAGAQSFTYPLAYRELLGMKFKVIAGYGGTPQRMLAVERGELDGFCGITMSTFRSQLTEPAQRGAIRLIAQAGTRKDPRYPEVPNILDQAKTPEIRQALEFLFVPLSLGRAIAAPPNVPNDRLDALRSAMLQAVKDPAFLEEASKLKLDLDTMDATETARVANLLFATPVAAVERLKSTITAK